jgi:hypothetical protein
MKTKTLSLLMLNGLVGCTSKYFWVTKRGRDKLESRGISLKEAARLLERPSHYLEN